MRMGEDIEVNCAYIVLGWKWNFSRWRVERSDTSHWANFTSVRGQYKSTMSSPVGLRVEDEGNTMTRVLCPEANRARHCALAIHLVCPFCLLLSGVASYWLPSYQTGEWRSSEMRNNVFRDSWGNLKTMALFQLSLKPRISCFLMCFSGTVPQWYSSYPWPQWVTTNTFEILFTEKESLLSHLPGKLITRILPCLDVNTFMTNFESLYKWQFSK